MIFSDSETWRDALVVECKEGMYNKKNKRDTLLKELRTWFYVENAPSKDISFALPSLCLKNL